MRMFLDRLASHASPRRTLNRYIAESERDCQVAQAANPSGEPHDWLKAAWLMRQSREGRSGLPAEIDAALASDETFLVACLGWEYAPKALGVKVFLKRYPGITGGNELIRAEQTGLDRLEQLDRDTVRAMYRRHNPRAAARRFGEPT